ncbi:hypothetical protein WDU99_04960 [Microbacterium sp. Mu-80]|uniref:AB hydrolase-1 domain-containing protein n=1 Tax=Microbacterium bandirmense TaxID=3122050 RepID=A0ABU8L9J5_9MICO
MTLRRLYVHGAGRRGAAAWPHADAADADFVSFPKESSIAEQADALVASFGDRMLIFAHSIGAVPVVLAADRLNIAGLVLVEPALYDIIRGDEAIERHIGIVSDARAQADAGDLRAFWAILRPLMFDGPFDPDTWDDERAVAQHWSTTNLPWGHGVRAGMLAGIPTLVVTGGWNQEYEVIAGKLASEGAQHIVLAGADHRAQDTPGFAAAVAAFERGLG